MRYCLWRTQESNLNTPTPDFVELTHFSEEYVGKLFDVRVRRTELLNFKESRIERGAEIKCVETLFHGIASIVEGRLPIAIFVLQVDLQVVRARLGVDPWQKV